MDEESDSEDEVVIPDEQDNDKLPFIQSFIFSLVWALGGYLEDKERCKLEEYLRGQVRLVYIFSFLSYLDIRYLMLKLYLISLGGHTFAGNIVTFPLTYVCEFLLLCQILTTFSKF